MLPRMLAAALVLACTAGAARAAAEIQFWHAMSGERGKQLDSLVARFNAAQKDVRVVATYKGQYPEVLEAAIAAYRGGQAPHVVQVYELGTAQAMAARQAIRPAWQLLEEAGVRLEGRQLVPAVASYFSDAHGKLLALPFNVSTPVMYLNRDAFRKAKLDPDQPPKTWYEMVITLGALKDAGVECALSTSFPSWVLVENMSAWHNQEFASHGNGMGGLDARLSFNTRLMVRWISVLTSWHKSEYFTYAGRGDEAMARFAKGECAIVTASSSRQGDLHRGVKFDWSVAQLPHYDDLDGAPQNTLIGGAGLWAVAGKKPEENRATGRFFGYLVQPDVQAEWHQATGYVPVTTAAYEQSKKAGFYTRHPGEEVAVRQLLVRSPTKDSRGIRIGPFPEVRAVIEDELEAAFKGERTPKEALDRAVDRGNELLRKFEAAHRGGSHAPAPAAPRKAPAKKAEAAPRK